MNTTKKPLVKADVRLGPEISQAADLLVEPELVEPDAPPDAPPNDVPPAPPVAVGAPPVAQDAPKVAQVHSQTELQIPCAFEQLGLGPLTSRRRSKGAKPLVPSTSVLPANPKA